MTCDDEREGGDSDSDSGEYDEFIAVLSRPTIQTDTTNNSNNNRNRRGKRDKKKAMCHYWCCKAWPTHFTLSWGWGGGEGVPKGGLP